MINLFKKLERENLLKQQGTLLDLGCGDGKASEPFFKNGYQVTLVDKNQEILSKAEERFKEVKPSGYTSMNILLENFKFEQNYGGIILSNSLPFLKSKEEIRRVVEDSWEHTEPGGFLFLTLFGSNDQWANERKDSMSFHDKDEALSIIETQPYFLSEDYGRGLTMKGDFKIWHTFSLLYIK